LRFVLPWQNNQYQLVRISIWQAPKVLKFPKLQKITSAKEAFLTILPAEAHTSAAVANVRGKHEPRCGEYFSEMF
jgi:hypothetical protein